MKPKKDKDGYCLECSSKICFCGCLDGDLPETDDDLFTEEENRIMDRYESMDGTEDE